MNSHEQDPFQSGITRRRFVAGIGAAALAAPGPANAENDPNGKRRVYIVPNFHPASCGWLTTFSRERVYCANSYLNHLDRVRDDSNYEFVLSEVNNIIAIMNFQPKRIAELKQRIAEKRVELVNGYFLESAINLSGGEAMLRLGVEGLRWYEHVFGLKPRFSWNIDVCGTHDQMPQIAKELGLEALVYTRKNPTGKSLFWSVSPDGSRILTICPGHYSEMSELFSAQTPLSHQQLEELDTFFQRKEPITPAGAPILVLAGAGDYALAPSVKSYPKQFLNDWGQSVPGREVEFSTLGKYVDAIRPGVESGQIQIPTFSGGTAYDFDAFWIENPEVKTLYRRNEHALQAAEMLATIASLDAKHQYPVDALHDCWLMLCLNMDRNTLWGSAGGMVFVDPGSWDVKDRFDWVEKTTSEHLAQAGHAMLRSGQDVGLFNPLNWRRDDPVALRLPTGTSIEGTHCEALPDGSTLCRIEIPSMSLAGFRISKNAPARVQPVPLPETIETDHYTVRLDSTSGSLVSLKLKANGREMLAGPANVIVAERPSQKDFRDDPGDKMPPRTERTRLAASTDQRSTIRCFKGPLTTSVEATSSFYGGGTLRRSVRFYQSHPRIDFETELNDVPNFTVAVCEFPLAEDITEIRRGIPYGFCHGAWSKPNADLHGWTKGIVPAVRWIDYELSGGGGVAIFDRGCSGREINERTPLIFLLNAEDKYLGYPNPWLTGSGKHVLPYSLYFHERNWQQARVPQMAWEYNREPILILDAAHNLNRSYCETSSNVIMEAMRRESSYVEVRLVECLGQPGTASLRFDLPHISAGITDALGREKSRFPKSSAYSFPVRPQQIVTLHFETSSHLPATEPVRAWDRFVPKAKLAALNAYDPSLIGHPPQGS